MRTFRLLALLLAATTSCVTPPRAGDDAAPTETSAPEAAAETGEKAKKAELPGALALEVAGLERELEESHLALEIAELVAEKDQAKAAREVQSTERAVGVARDKWAHYRDVESQLALSKSQLAVDRAVSRLESQRQDLQGILEIYEGEEEARAKDEIIRRNRKGVEFAEKGLEQARLQARLVAEFEVPEKLESLQWGLRDAEASKQRADDALVRTQMEGRLALLRKRNKLIAAEQKLELKRAKLEKDPSGSDAGEGAE